MLLLLLLLSWLLLLLVVVVVVGGGGGGGGVVVVAVFVQRESRKRLTHRPGAPTPDALSAETLTSLTPSTQ